MICSEACCAVSVIYVGSYWGAIEPYFYVIH